MCYVLLFRGTDPCDENKKHAWELYLQQVRESAVSTQMSGYHRSF